VFASTRYDSDALPCPDVADVSATHDADEDADHVQSRVVETASCPVVPFAGAEIVALSTETWHFGVSGAVTDTAVDPHAAHSRARTNDVSADESGRARIRSTCGASILPARIDEVDQRDGMVARSEDPEHFHDIGYRLMRSASSRQ